MKRDLTVLKAIIKADYDRHVKRFEQLKPNKDIVFIGDSIVAYFPLRTYELRPRIHNLGIPGDTTQGVMDRIHQVIPLHPKKLILHIGLNDEILSEKTSEQTVQSIQMIVAYLKSELPDTKLIVVSLTPINQSAFPHGEYVIDRNPLFSIKVNQGIEHMKDMTYINIYPWLIDAHGELDKNYTTDGIHLNDKGYQIYFKLLKSVL